MNSQHTGNDAIVTRQPEKNQPVQCEVCNVACNNEDLLEKHKQGKKHMKNLEKQAISSFIAPKIPQPPVATAPLVREVENKTQKLVQHGASVDKMLSCNICNVVCNNQDVFAKHIAGKKHSAKVIFQLANMNGFFNPSPGFSLVAQPLSSGSQKKTNSHQPTRCELCNISCTSNELLTMHLAGKKHLRKLQELQNVSDPAMQNSSNEEGKVVNPDGSNRKAKRVETQEDLAVKKQKVLQGGAALHALRTCTVCNVVCNSPTVFLAHLAGQKHAAMAVKQAEAGSSGQKT